MPRTNVVAYALAGALSLLAQTATAQSGGLMSLVAFGAQNLYINHTTAVLDFDQMEAPCDPSIASPLTNQLSSFGVTFSGNGSVVNQCSELISAGAQSGTNYLAIQPNSAGSQEWITFAAPQMNALLSLIGIGSVGIDAYLGEAMVNQGSFSFESADVWSQPILVQGAAFDQLAIHNTGESPSLWGIDDLYATPAHAVPEPRNTVLLWVGLLGMLFGATRRRTTTV